MPLRHPRGLNYLVTMAVELPPADSKHRSADTYVFLAMKDGSILANSSPYGFLGKIERAVVEKGYGGSLSVEGHVFEDLSDMFPYDFYWGHNFYVTIDAGFHQPLLRIFSKLILYPREKKSNLLILSNFKEFEEATELEEVRRCLEARDINVVLAHIDKVIKPDECECNAEFVLLEDSLLAGYEMPKVPDCEFVDWQAELRKSHNVQEVPDCGTEVPDYESKVPCYGSEGPDYNDLGFDDYKPRINIGSDGYVFWDVHDYPIPDENCAETFFSNIEANLAMRGCKNVRIYAYILGKGIMSLVHLLRKYGFIPICLRKEICVLVRPSDLLDEHVLLDTQMFAIASQGTINGIWRMLLDIYICSAGSAGNIFVVSKKFTEKDDSLHYLESLYSRGFGVFLSNPGRDCTLALPKESNASFLRSLFMKRGRMDNCADSDADAEEVVISTRLALTTEGNESTVDVLC